MQHGESRCRVAEAKRHAGWAALRHRMEYLEGKPSFKLTYRKRSSLSNGLSGYCDSDLGQQRINLFLYNRAPISWKSKLHKKHDRLANCGGGALPCLHGGGGSDAPPVPAEEHEVGPADADACP